MIRTIGNLLWFVLAGFWMAIGYVLFGVGLCLTIIGIPFGIQGFKFAQFVWWPFGKAVVQTNGGGLVAVANVIWVVVAGIWLAIGHVLAGVLLCITIIGIPFGIVSFRLAGLCLTPFGRKVVAASEAADDDSATVFASRP